MPKLEELENFKIERRKLFLPKPEEGKGNLIFLPYVSSEDCVKSIIDSPNLVRLSYWKYIYKDFKYKFKMYNKSVFYNNLKERNKTYEYYKTQDKTLIGVKNFDLIRAKNAYIDLSFFINKFFEFKKKNWKNTLKQFFTIINSQINSPLYENIKDRMIVFNINTWKLNTKDYSILNNPFSILYLALRKDLEGIKSLGDIKIIITDGTKSFFIFKPSDVDKLSYLDFKLSLSKLKPDLLDKDLDNDNHLNTYGDISSNAPESELEKAKIENKESEFDISDNEDKEETIIDKINKLNKDNDIKPDIDDEEPEEEEPETSEDDEDKDPEEDKKVSEEDKEKDMEKELVDELGVTDETTADEVQQVLDNKVPNTARGARERILIEEQKKLKIDKDRTLEDVLNQAKNNPSYKKIYVTDVTKKVNTLNKNLTKITFKNFEESYNKEVFEHDFYSIFNSLSEKKDLPVYIRNVTKEDTSDSLFLKDTYKFELEDGVYGRRHTLTIDVPKFIDDKFMYLGGNKKIFIKQLILKPIVKISPDTVQLCSNYSKIFMFRYGEEVSPYLQNMIKLLNSDSKYFTVKKGNATALNKDYKTTIEYDNIAKTIIEIKIKKTGTVFLFSQEEVNKFFKEHDSMIVDEFKKLDRDKYLIFGFEKSKENNKWMPLITESDSGVIASADFNNGDDIDPVDTPKDQVVGDIIGTIAYAIKKAFSDFNADTFIKESGMKVGKRYIFSRCKIMNKMVPTILLLSYCEGLETVLRKAKIKYEFSQTRPKFAGNSEKLRRGVIQFADGYLIFDRYPIENSLLMNGFTLVDTKAYEFEEMQSKGAYIDIFGNLYDSRILASAFDSFYDNMIDPITKELLESMNYPSDFVQLMIMANALLADNNFSSEIDMNNFRVRSNEMVNGMLYKIIANAFSKYKRTAMNKNPVKISVPRSCLIKEILTSQSVENYSVLNPIVDIAKTRAITSKGPSGINLDQAYTEEKRSFDPSMTGLMSMSTSPDGNCGVVRALTADPKVISPRGFIDTKKSPNEMTDANVFSYEEMLTPLGVTRDDSIRTAMATKQSKHIIPVSRMDPVLISNGAEKTLPYNVGSDFSIVAPEDGVVEKIDPETNLMIVTFKSGRKKIINLNSQVNKNGAGGFFLEMKMKPYFKEGDKFEANDVLAADSRFFNNYQDGIKFNIGTLCKVACMSAYYTFEDSAAVTQRLSHKMSSEITMEKHIVLGKNANVISIVKPGQKISVNQPLIEYEQSNDDEAINKLLANIDNDLKEQVTSLSRGVLKSKYTGEVVDVKVYSTCELEELSPSLQPIVKEYWDKVKKQKEMITKNNIIDATDTGELYKLDSGPVTTINGKVKGFDVGDGVLILIYIKYHNPFSIGDKLVNFCALKGVCTEIIPLGKEPYSDFRPDEEISSIFPPGGINNMCRYRSNMILANYFNCWKLSKETISSQVIKTKKKKNARNSAILRIPS